MTKRGEPPPIGGQVRSGDERVEAILASMTLDQKLAELASPLRLAFTATGASPLPRDEPNASLGVRSLKQGECLHGVMVWAGEDAPATSFPQAIALGCTWDPELVEAIGTAIAAEARALGYHQCFGPVVDVARDPRFGRIEETFGEDPLLVSRLGVAMIHGLQGRGEKRFDADHILATAKHFVGYHDGAAGRNGAVVDISERTLHEIHLPPFRAAVVEAGVASVMPAHGDIEGVPCHADHRLLTSLLRGDWGFEGFVVTDNRDVARLHDMHRVAGDYAEAARLALTAGCDQELVLQEQDVRCFGDPLRGEVAAGRVTEAQITEAARRVLRAKSWIGLLDAADPTAANRTTKVGCADHRALALRAAREAIVLLRNEADLLPLQRTAVRRLAVIGPLADEAALGGFTGWNRSKTVTVLEGLRLIAGDDVTVHHANGPDDVVGADVVVAVVGDTADTVGEGKDRQTLGLPGDQQGLLESVLATGVPMIAVLINGRPFALPWMAESVGAIIEAWFPGVEGGRAIGEVIFGDVNPSGRLCVTFPRAVGQVPLTYMRRPSFNGSGRGRYIDGELSPLWSFGHGLSFTTFDYRDLTVSATIGPGDSATVEVTVVNTGRRDGEHVVVLMVTDEVASVTRPVERLCGFRRVSIAAGCAERVSFVVGPAELAMLDRDLRPVVEPGIFTLAVGPLKATLSVT